MVRRSRSRPSLPLHTLTMDYFAYASNMAEDVMARKAPGHSTLGVASLDDYRLEFTRRSIRSHAGVADVVASPGERVWGVLYSLTDDDLAALDRKEGLGWAYAHLEVPVVLTDGSVHDAVTYTVVTKEPTRVPPSADYRDRLIAAARGRGLPADYVAFLESIPAAEPDPVAGAGQ